MKARERTLYGGMNSIEPDYGVTCTFAYTWRTDAVTGEKRPICGCDRKTRGKECAQCGFNEAVRNERLTRFYAKRAERAGQSA